VSSSSPPPLTANSVVLESNNSSSSSSSHLVGSQQATSVGETTTNNKAFDESAQPLKIPASQRSEDYQKLVEYGLHEKVAAKLDDVYNTGKLAHSDLDERALDALKEFPVEGALTVLKQFLDSNLEHVSNKSAYLCGVMKTYRQKSRSGQSNTPVAQSSAIKGPDEEKIKSILARTGYSLDVTTGQRKYGGPPPNFEGIPPGNGCEVFCGKIPKDMYEDELIPLFENCGKIWDLRLMMDPMTGLNRGYAFVTFTNRDGAVEAVKQLNEFEIRKGKKVGVTISYNNHRLFVGNIPKNRDHDEIFEEFSKHAPGLTEVIIYSSPDDRKKNRGFCFLEYESHKAASLAKRRLGTARVRVFGCDIIVDWADPQEEPDDETMSKVKVLYVRNLTHETMEDKLKEAFEVHGPVDRVKKIKDYAFIHFEERDSAEKALNEMNGKEVCGSVIDISLAKPPSDKKRKEEVLRARERRMMQMMVQHRPTLMSPVSIGRPGRGGMRGPFGRNDFAWPWVWGGDASAGWVGGRTGNGTGPAATPRWAEAGVGDMWNTGAGWGSGGGGFRGGLGGAGAGGAVPWAWNTNTGSGGGGGGRPYTGNGWSRGSGSGSAIPEHHHHRGPKKFSNQSQKITSSTTN